MNSGFKTGVDDGSAIYFCVDAGVEIEAAITDGKSTYVRRSADCMHLHLYKTQMRWLWIFSPSMFLRTDCWRLSIDGLSLAPKAHIRGLALEIWGDNYHLS